MNDKITNHEKPGTRRNHEGFCSSPWLHGSVANGFSSMETWAAASRSALIFPGAASRTPAPGETATNVAAGRMSEPGGKIHGLFSAA
jgi:hypothetical protein